MNRTRWLLTASYLALPIAGILSLPGCSDKGESGTVVQGTYDQQKDRDQHDAQRKYMQELQRKQGRR